MFAESAWQENNIQDDKNIKILKAQKKTIDLTAMKDKLKKAGKNQAKY